MNVFCVCSHCGALDLHRVTDIVMKERKGKTYRVYIARCSRCGREFEAVWEG